MRNWQKQDGNYFLRDITSQQASLPNEIFNVYIKPTLK